MVDGRPANIGRFELPALALAIALVLLSSVGCVVTSAWGESPAHRDGAAATAGVSADTWGAGGEGSGDAAGAAGDSAGEGSADYSSRVFELLQFPDMPAGCEAYSLAAVLSALDYEADPREIVAADLPFASDGGVSADVYAGDPYTAGEGLPPAIVAAGNSYAARVGGAEQFVDATGAAFDELLARADGGSPVLVWTTTYLRDPGFAEPLSAYSFYDLEHCVVLLGSEGERVRVMDPMVGLTDYDRAWFAQVYELCGSMAVEIAD